LEKLTKKRLVEFNYLLYCLRNPGGQVYHKTTDFIEIYHEVERDWLSVIERDILYGSRKTDDHSVLSMLTPEDSNEDKLVSEDIADSSLVA
jgi:hypothetical protein